MDAWVLAVLAALPVFQQQVRSPYRDPFPRVHPAAAWLFPALLSVALLYVCRAQLSCALYSACGTKAEQQERRARVYKLSRLAKSSVAVRTLSLGSSLEGMGPAAALASVFAAAHKGAEDQSARVRLQQQLAAEPAALEQPAAPVAAAAEQAQQPPAAELAAPADEPEAMQVGDEATALTAPAGMEAVAPAGEAQQPQPQPAQHQVAAAGQAESGTPATAAPMPPVLLAQADGPAESVAAAAAPVAAAAAGGHEPTGAYLLRMLQGDAGMPAPHMQTMVACLEERPATEPIMVSLAAIEQRMVHVSASAAAAPAQTATANDPPNQPAAPPAGCPAPLQHAASDTSVLPAGASRQGGSDDGSSASGATSLASSAGASEDHEAPAGGQGGDSSLDLAHFMSQLHLGTNLPGIAFEQVSMGRACW